ncbi:hypothetical protein KI387_039937, partial [Taxus chinensis]
MGIPIKCILEMGNQPASASVGKRAESRSVGCRVVDGECSPRGKGIPTRSMMGGRDDGSSSMSVVRIWVEEVMGVLLYVGGGGNGCSSMGGGGMVGKGSLSGEARGEMVSMSVEDSFGGDVGDEGCSSIGEGTVMVGSNVEGGFRARISSMEG